MTQQSVTQILKTLGIDPFEPIRSRSNAKRARRSRNRQKRRTLRKFTYDVWDNQFHLKDIMNTQEKTFLGVSDFDDLLTTELLTQRIDRHAATFHQETTVLSNRQKWNEYIEKEFGASEEYILVQSNNSHGLVLDLQHQNYLSYNVDSNSTTVRASGDAEFVSSMIEQVETEFSVVTSYIDWIYSGDGNSVNVPLNLERLPVAEMYPFLKGESLESYYDRYMASSANILLLIGPPGTGKTTFIRGLLAHTQESAVVTYDAAILEKDYLFAKFIEGEESVMVLEDSDAFLKSRSDGNTMMHRFLNVGDGLVTTKGKKLLFSTNLPSVRDIDSALVRPGRCFDIVTFDLLSHDEAVKLANRLGVSLDEKKDKYSLAEIFHKQEIAPATPKRTMGFV
jgi:ATPase family associated with various cellular activities (AAA)